MTTFDICRHALGMFYAWHPYLMTVIHGLPFC